MLQRLLFPLWCCWQTMLIFLCCRTKGTNLSRKKYLCSTTCEVIPKPAAFRSIPIPAPRQWGSHPGADNTSASLDTQLILLRLLKNYENGPQKLSEKRKPWEDAAVEPGRSHWFPLTAGVHPEHTALDFFFHPDWPSDLQHPGISSATLKVW